MICTGKLTDQADSLI